MECKLCGESWPAGPDDAKLDALVLIFSCMCGRSQAFAREMKKGGVTIEEAEGIGWTFDRGAWWCPFCSKR